MSKTVKQTTEITGKINLGELVNRFPKAMEILKQEYGLHCVGCLMAQFESLGDGLKAHGYGKKEIEKIIKKLNQLDG